MSRYYVVPEGFTLIGTCGYCGGPVLSPQSWTFSDPEYPDPPKTCAVCHKQAKDIIPAYGPILEMKP